MSTQFQYSTYRTGITKPLATAIEANKPLYLITNISAEKPGSMGTPPPSQILSPGEASQNVVQSSDKVSEGDTSLNEPGPWIPIPIGGAPTFSCLKKLLCTSAEGQCSFLPETDYIPLTIHSLIHMGIGQETPAWIITHLGIIEEEKPSDKTKLGFRSLICLHDVNLTQCNSGFESP
jgi:hypothetical protein